MSRGVTAVGRCGEAALETASLITIVVADDEILERRLLAALERGRPGTCASASSLDEALDGSSGDAPRVAVVSRRSVPEALDALRGLRERRELRIVVVVADATPVHVRELFAGGADGLVLEQAVDLSLATTVDAVSSGQLVLPRTRRDHVAPPPLSTREKQVLGLVVLGLSNGEVAAKLHVAETTVKSHLTSGFRKLGVRSRSEATARLLDPHDGFGLGVLSIAGTDASLDVFDAT